MLYTIMTLGRCIAKPTHYISPSSPSRGACVHARRCCSVRGGIIVSQGKRTFRSSAVWARRVCDASGMNARRILFMVSCTFNGERDVASPCRRRRAVSVQTVLRLEGRGRLQFRIVIPISHLYRPCCSPVKYVPTQRLTYLRRCVVAVPTTSIRSSNLGRVPAADRSRRTFYNKETRSEGWAERPS